MSRLPSINLIRTTAHYALIVLAIAVILITLFFTFIPQLDITPPHREVFHPEHNPPNLTDDYAIFVAKETMHRAGFDLGEWKPDPPTDTPSSATRFVVFNHEPSFFHRQRSPRRVIIKSDGDAVMVMIAGHK
ncbi:MAG: hypothetical protein QM770_20110 [Tepidisphaeraceae bacterium]